ncbi:MAG: deoxyribonuclease IV [Candidatus Longimicrobiales bacterium M2_2A_002]
MSPHQGGVHDELGAHVSVAGGTPNAPARAAALDAAVMQVFTKQPNRWAERQVDDDEAAAFRAARDEQGIRTVASHDSYLINLATPDATLLQRSLSSFIAEVRRCEVLGIEYIVSHPGNATDGDPDRGLAQNADAIIDALDAVPGSARVLLEGTAGSGTALGATFEELGSLVDRIGQAHPDRIGVCLDSCHLWAAGYDIRHLDDVLDRLDGTVGLEHLRFLHLNDSVAAFDSRRDRHADIGQGTIGEDGFRAIMTHDALREIPKVIETPKGDDPEAADRANLALLRSFRD